MTGTKPPRGAVKVSSTDSGKDGIKHLAECSNCGWCYGNSVRSDVEQHEVIAKRLAQGALDFGDAS